MGGTQAVGVLLDGGEVRYYLVPDGTFGMMDILQQTKQHHRDMCEKLTTLETYFAYETFEEEDSASRYLVMENNRVIVRVYGDTEEYELICRVIQKMDSKTED
jgi:hypothetical protein